jgi:hypothetical protein
LAGIDRLRMPHRLLWSRHARALGHLVHTAGGMGDRDFVPALLACARVEDSGWNVTGISRRDSPLSGGGYVHLVADVASDDYFEHGASCATMSRLSIQRSCHWSRPRPIHGSSEGRLRRSPVTSVLAHTKMPRRMEEGVLGSDLPPSNPRTINMKRESMPRHFLTT